MLQLELAAAGSLTTEEFIERVRTVVFFMSWMNSVDCML